MSLLSTISVDDGTLAGVVEIVPALPVGQSRNFVILGRTDTGTDKLALSVGLHKFSFGEAALWIAAGERLVFTPDDVLWPLISQGIFGICDTGVTVSVNVQLG
jgi:hypothetical protein